MEHSFEKRPLSRASDVRARCGNLSNQQLLRLEAKGLFPHRVYISPTVIAYYDDEVDEWVNSRIRAGGRPVARGPRSKKREAADAAE